MRHAVLAAAVAFNPRLAWARRPFVGATRRMSRAVLAWLDRRRALVDDRRPPR